MKPLIETNEEKSIALFNSALTHEKSDTVILADVSGSMDQFIPAARMSRMEAMKNMLLRVVSAMDQAAVFMFASRTQRLESWETIAQRYFCGGSTRLAPALRAASKMNPSHIVVITDGEPHDMQEALDTARAMLCRIDVYYCGPGETRCVQFCKDLAQYGGEAVIDPSCVTMLESVNLFLTDRVIAV